MYAQIPDRHKLSRESGPWSIQKCYFQTVMYLKCYNHLHKMQQLSTHSQMKSSTDDRKPWAHLPLWLTLCAIIALHKIHSSLITLYYLYCWTPEDNFAIKFNFQSLFSTNLLAEEKWNWLSYTLHAMSWMVMIISWVVRPQTYQFYHIGRLKYCNCQNFIS